MKILRYVGAGLLILSIAVGAYAFTIGPGPDITGGFFGPPPSEDGFEVGDVLLMETGDALLLETGDKLLLE